ncbi:MAG TPA: cytochrome c oxidase subunit 3, partial [Myxococcota bacterium]|nr:cytochrome c oxidase subunit 3 [Myxococcota bacterium]
FMQTDRAKRAALALSACWILGFSFLLLKAYEYYDDIEKGLVPTEHVAIQGAGSYVARMFYLIYYTITGVHALHLTIGLFIVMVMILRIYKQKLSAHYYTPLELTGLYWHFVDIVWVFIYPLLYLVGRES